MLRARLLLSPTITSRGDLHYWGLSCIRNLNEGSNEWVRNKQTLLGGCERIKAGGQLSGVTREYHLKTTVYFCCGSSLSLILANLTRNSGLWPQLPDLMGLELEWEDKHSFPQGLRRVRGRREWMRKRHRWYKWMNEAPDNLILWRRTLPQFARLFWAINRIKQKEFPRLTDMGSFLFKSQSQVRRTERTPGDGAFSQHRDGGGGLEEILPYAGRAHWSQGQLPPGRSRISAGPCPAWSSSLPSLPGFCVSAPRSSVSAPPGAAASGLSSVCRAGSRFSTGQLPAAAAPLHDRSVSAPRTATPTISPEARVLRSCPLLDSCLVIPGHKISV